VLDFQFKEETHEYFLSGVRIPGVTEILENVGISDFSMVPKETLERAQRRGTRVHKICELWDRDKLNLDSLTLEDMGYLEAWRAFSKKYGVEIPELWEFNEAKLYSKKFGFAGTLDRYIKGILVDIKTGVKEKSHPVQLAAYRQLLIERYSLRSNVNILIINVYLKPDGTFFDQCWNSRNDWNVFLSAKNVFTFKNGG